MPEFGFGAFLGAAITMILLAAFALPQWQNLVIDTKSEACQNLGAAFDRDGEHFKGGTCIKGNTIIYRFKD
jgi:hypothetical protein